MIQSRKSMPLWQKIIYCLAFAILIVLFIYLGTKDYSNTKRTLSDAESFTAEYGITANNVFVYTTGKEVLEILNSGSGIIFMAFKENKWSSAYADMLNEAAQNLGISQIYYYDFQSDRSSKSAYYLNIVNKLSSYTYVLDDDTTDIYAPTLIVVRDGNIVGYDDETAIVHGEESIDDYWNTETKAKKIIELGVLLSRYEDAS